MNSSGLAVDQELVKRWSALSPATIYIKIEIDGEKFKVTHEEKGTGDWKADWKNMVKSLKPNDCVYVLFRTEEDPKNWVFMPHVPDNAHVRKKMLYASSQGALKTGLDSSKFTKNFYVTSPAEATLENYYKSGESTDVKSMMTFDEQEKEAAHMESHMAMADTKAQAIVGVPIDLTADCLKAIETIGKDHNTVIMGVQGDSEKLEALFKGKTTLDEAATKLPEDLPRYILHEYEAEEKDGEKTKVFIYYCPAKAKPRARMFYSTCKNNVVLVFEKLGLVVPKKLECSELDEVSDAEIHKILYPEAEVVEKQSKPKAKQKAKFRGAKFQA